VSTENPEAFHVGEGEPGPRATPRDETVADQVAEASDRGFLPTEPARRTPESVLVRFIATAGIIGIGTALGAILAANDVKGWITGIVVSGVSVVLAAILWRSRRL
jgi:hypothetical protein